MPDQATCRSCGKLILWAKTPAGKAMPLDPEPNEERGNVYLATDGTIKILTGEELTTARAAKIQLHLSHFASCPGAAKHRRKK